MKMAVSCAILAGALSAWAQETPPQGYFWDAPKFPDKAYFRQITGPDIPRYQLREPIRLNDFVIGDKLELSLKSYLELVLANNTDIQIQRLSLEIPKNNITRQYGIFDPLLFGQFNATRSNTQASDILAGANTVSSLAQPWQFGYQQVLPTGTQFNVGFNGAKNSTNSQFQTFNPAYTSQLNFRFTQPLLRGRGRDVTRLPISIARSQLKQAGYNMGDAMIRLLVVAERAYWDVVEARENLRVQENFMALTKAALDRSQKELELGAISALEIYQPQQQYATAEFQVTQARYRLAQLEDALRRQASIDLDADARRLPIVLTEPVSPAVDELDFDKEGLVQRAMQLRPDFKSNLQQLDVDELQMKSARNGLLPDFRLGGGYTTTGRGGVFFPRSTALGSTTALAPVPGGIGDAFDQMLGFGFPIYNLSLSLTLPIRDRRAAADYADANVRRHRDLLQVRSVEQTVRLEVLNAINQVESSRSSVKLAQIARDFAQKRVDAEQKRYELGTTVLFFVLQAQQDLTQAESNLVRESINYRRNQLQLLQRTGELLQERGVVIQ